MKILLVDDEHELVSAMAERLQIRGFDAEWASNADDAFALVEKGCHDIAVLDMKMPGMSGLELRTLLAQKCPSMKYIFLSGHGSEEDFKKGSAQAESYLIKPIRIEDLIEKIQSALA